MFRILHVIKIFVIEDHYLIVSGLKNTFRSNNDGIRVIGSAQNITDAIEQLNETKADIVILDLYLKNDNPIENIQRLIKAQPLIPVVILTVETSAFWQKTMFREGAKAYIDKGESKTNIKNSLIQVAQGQTVIPFDIQAQLQSEQSGVGRLKSDERRIVKLFTAGMSLKEIAIMEEKSVSSLDKMLQRIRIRFEAKNIPELIKILIQKKEI
ncbi:MAG: response regulator [bacterium]